MNVVFLGLGGNIGDRSETLKESLKLIEVCCGNIISRSHVYETAAWGFKSENNYLNLVIKIHTHLEAAELLEKTMAIEKKFGRKRDSHQNSDRTLDIDILFFNEDIIYLEQIQIPHPRLHLRKFVLIPLQDIAPDLVHPVLKENTRTLLRNCKDSLAISRFDEK